MFTLVLKHKKLHLPNSIYTYLTSRPGMLAKAMTIITSELAFVAASVRPFLNSC